VPAIRCPTSLLKGNVVTQVPFLVELINRCLTDGVVPMNCKSAYITPLLKKPDLDASDPKSYRSIYYLSILSKLLESVVARQLNNDLQQSTFVLRLVCMPSSALDGNRVLKVLSDILRAVDRGDIAALALSDLSAAFDTVDHATLWR
jgi:hypothetical protein